jgi:hypothetical protein
MLGVAGLTFGKDKVQRTTTTVGHQVDLGRRTASTAPDGFVFELGIGPFVRFSPSFVSLLGGMAPVNLFL